MPRLAFRPLVLIAILALMAVIVGAQAPVPQPADQETARIVVDLLERGHMARPVIDDQIAVKWCDNFIKELDPKAGVRDLGAVSPGDFFNLLGQYRNLLAHGAHPSRYQLQRVARILKPAMRHLFDAADQQLDALNH